MGVIKGCNEGRLADFFSANRTDFSIAGNSRFARPADERVGEQAGWKEPGAPVDPIDVIPLPGVGLPGRG